MQVDRFADGGVGTIAKVRIFGFGVGEGVGGVGGEGKVEGHGQGVNVHVGFTVAAPLIRGAKAGLPPILELMTVGMTEPANPKSMRMALPLQIIMLPGWASR